MQAPQRMHCSVCRKLLVGEGLRAAVVDQHQMHLLRAILFAFLARAGDHVEVGGDRLAGRRARQQAVERHHVLELFDHLLDAGDGDSTRPAPWLHAAVALVLDKADGAGLGDGEIDAGEADLGFHELLRSTSRPIWISASTSSV